MRPAPADEGSCRIRCDAAFAAAKVPGLQYLAVGSDGPVFEYTGGFANLADARSMGAGTTQMAYSMSKTITAAAVLTLVGSEKVGLDDAIDRYVEGSPYGSAITVRQLLAHTSGIPNPIPLRWVHAAERNAGFDEEAALQAVLRRHPRLSSEPGAKYAYSNIGYWLLGSVVARASGRRFTEYVRERVLAPLAIAREELAYDIVDPGRHAAGYLVRWSLFNLMKRFLIDRALIGSRRGNWIEIRPHQLNGPAFGGLVGTARAFGKLLSDQLRPGSAILSDPARALFYEQQRTIDGHPIPMTLGWHIGSIGSRRYFFKEGGGGGFHCMMRLYPERGVGTVVIANATGFNAARFLNAVDPRTMA
jgi:CubicO group peptidase (beta-lactamase class C family)